jgi:hypothetical protein
MESIPVDKLQGLLDKLVPGKMYVLHNADAAIAKAVIEAAKIKGCKVEIINDLEGLKGLDHQKSFTVGDFLAVGINSHMFDCMDEMSNMLRDAPIRDKRVKKGKTAKLSRQPWQ